MKRLKQHLRYCEKGKDNETFVEEEYISSRLKDQSSDIGFKKQDIHPDADICPTAAKSSDNDGEYGDNCELCSTMMLTVPSIHCTGKLWQSQT